MGVPSCACIPPDGEDWSGRWIRECDYHAAMRAENERLYGMLGRKDAKLVALRAENERMRGAIHEALRLLGMDRPVNPADVLRAALRGGNQ